MKKASDSLPIDFIEQDQASLTILINVLMCVPPWFEDESDGGVAHSGDEHSPPSWNLADIATPHLVITDSLTTTSSTLTALTHISMMIKPGSSQTLLNVGIQLQADKDTDHLDVMVTEKKTIIDYSQELDASTNFMSCGFNPDNSLHNPAYFLEV
jgi:hypothetical protein